MLSVCTLLGQVEIMTTDLQNFINNKMRMSHIYQPVMLKVLLKSDGEATVNQIASSLLSYDQSQVEYYALRTKNMVGKVLANNGVVEPIKSGPKITGYRLLVDTLTDAQTASLINLCDKYIHRLHQQTWRRSMATQGL